MHSPYLIYKPLGVSPLQALQLFQAQSGLELPESLSYAGRLDPMAEGLLLIVDGKNVALRQQLLGLPKRYKAEILIGATTDSGDILGRIISSGSRVITDNEPKMFTQKLKGYHELSVPKYSSVSISRSSFSELANEQYSATLPVKKMNCLEIVYKGQKTVLIQDILDKLAIAEKYLYGDFRHEVIKNSWLAVGRSQPDFKVIELEFLVTSGTYIRSLARYLGEQLGVDTCLYGLVRETVGDFKLDDAFKVSLG